MSPEDTARHAWHSAGANPTLPAIETLRARSDLFRRQIARRNALEYAAGLFVVAGFGFTMIAVPLPLMQVASAMIIAATAYVLWQLHRRGSNLPGERATGTLPVLVQQRAAIVRQRNALRGVFGWYIAPYLPGLVLFVAAIVAADPPAIGSEAFFRVIGSAAFIAAVFAGIWWLNRAAARDLGKRIAEIDALLAD